MTTHPEFVNLLPWMPSEYAEDPGFPADLWKLPTSLGHDPLCAILMSYLLSSSRHDLRRDLNKRLKVLFSSSNTGVAVCVSSKKMKRNVLSHNPFRNNICVFNTEVLQKILLNFKQKLKNCDNVDDQSESTTILKAASKVLKCSIVLYETDENNIKRIENHPISGYVSSRKLYIFQEPFHNKPMTSLNSSNKNSLFCFGMTEEDAFPHRQNSFVHILKIAEISDDEIKDLKSKISYKENFLIFLLQNMWGVLHTSYIRLLRLIYNFPYIARKLSEAGFNTNPLKTDQNGLSAFFYCMNFEDTSILRLLYNYASNNFHQSDNSVRKPKLDILHALKNIERTLRSDYLQSNEFSSLEKKNLALKTHNQILRFNKYQNDVVEKITNIEDNHLQNINIMISILDSYCNNFYFDSTQLKDSGSNFKDYIKFNDYYNCLDTFSFLLFFDNLISLSSLVNKDNVNVYTDAVSSVLLAVLGNNFFAMKKHGVHCKNRCNFNEEICEETHNKHLFIPFCYRLDYLRNAEKLKKQLETSLNEHRTESEVTVDVVRSSLIELPEITNEFLSKRIENYLLPVCNRSLKGDTVKNMLIVERTLQVIGEVVQNETINDCPIRHLICSLFPKDIEHQLSQLRNHCFSKYRANSIQGRLAFERNQALFEIQKGFISMFRNFKPFYVSQCHATKMSLIEKGQKLSQALCNSVVDNIDRIREEFENRQKSEFKVFKNYLEFTTFYIINFTINEMKECDELERLEPKTLKRLKSQMKALIYSFGCIAHHDTNPQTKLLKDNIADLNLFIIQIEEGNFSSELWQKCMNILTNCLSNFSNVNQNFESDLICNINFNGLKGLFSELNKNNVFTPEEESNIREEITKYLQKSKDAIIYCLQHSVSLTPSTLRKKLMTIVMTEKNRNYINCTFAKDTKKSLKCLKNVNVVEESSIFKEGENITQTLMSMCEKGEYREMLLNLPFKRGLRKKIYEIMNQKMCFLLNRIDKMRMILIKEDGHVQYLWNKCENMRKHAKLLICRRYLHERAMRAALEILLFDCMNILNSEDLKKLWEKSTDLFSGVNLRDVLSHGNPVLEIVGGLLEPRDLPTALIDKIAELIDDRAALSALSELWYRLKLGKIKGMVTAVTTNRKPALCKKIISSSRWKEYVKLLPIER